ncbi:MAG: hypothetical protein C5B59_03680 [Bacteroidetes bacterium]|nr:MAG: hypothetical protein C5B59_03680 [Bacteroidota bacterium]
MNTHIYIGKEDEVQTVQGRFSCVYPYLRITFFKNKGNHSKLVGDRSISFSPDVKMREINNDFCEGELEINDKTTVSELENTFYKKFGLSAQVSRISGNLWMDASKTGHLTLKDQNEHGREISPGFTAIPVIFKDVPFGC